MLCDAVAQGLIEPWCVTPVRVDQEQRETEKAIVQPTAEKTKRVRGKSVEKPGATHGPVLDAAAMQELKKALEVSDCFSPIGAVNTQTHWKLPLCKALWVISDHNWTL